MGFNRGEIRVKATNNSEVDRKGGESINNSFLLNLVTITYFHPKNS